MKPHLHQLPDLFDAAASLLERLGPVTGLRVGFHTTLPEGVRLLVNTGLPYTDEVGPLDQIGVVLNAPVVHERERTTGLGHAHVHGAWNGTPVYGSHVYSDLPPTDKPCTQSAATLSRRIRALIPWTQRDWTRWAESVAVYDENGTPCAHVVLASHRRQDEALAELLDATGSLQYRHEREHDYVAHGSVLLDDGTVVTVSSIDPQPTGGAS